MNTAANIFHFTNSNSAATAAAATAAAADVATASADASTSVTTGSYLLRRGEIKFVRSFLSRFNISFPMTFLGH